MASMKILLHAFHMLPPLQYTWRRLVWKGALQLDWLPTLPLAAKANDDVITVAMAINTNECPHT